MVTIRTPDQRLRVFVSSTLGELAPERAAVRAAIDALRLTPVMFELGARPHPPRDLYRAYLEQSDVFVGLYWQRYGWVAPDMAVSGLEDEYDLCGSRPRLLYIKEPAAHREPGLAALLERIEAEAHGCYRRFRGTEELVDLVRDDLAVLLTERFLQHPDVAAATGPTSVTGGPPAAAPPASASPVSGSPTPGPPASGSHGPASPSGTSRGRPLPSPVDRHVTRLPVPATSLVGRDHDVTQVVDLLQRDTVRLVTLTGPGGIGKTRLAIAVAERLAPDVTGGVPYVPLASVREPSLVLGAIASAVGASLEGGRSPFDALVDHFEGPTTLLVLDNLEQVVEAGPRLAELLAACPTLSVLATSRRVLRLRGEHEYPVPTLDVVPQDRGAWVRQLGRTPAVELFVDRARAARHDFELTEHNALAVAEICRRLDGLPLAIELAAARVRLLAPTALLARLGHRLEMLGAGPADLPERQKTLRATIEWSTDLLSEEERALLVTLAAFSDGWTLEAAARVCALDELAALEMLDALAAHSLVVLAPRGDELRFRLLETVREYAAELLEARADAAEVARRHAEHFEWFAAEAGPRLRGVEQQEALAALTAEHGNLRRTIEWLLGNGEYARAAHVFRALFLYWWLQELGVEAKPWVDRALEHREELDPLSRAELTWVAASVAMELGEVDASKRWIDEAEHLVRTTVDDPLLHGFVCMIAGFVHLRPERLEEALSRFQAHGEEFLAALALTGSGMFRLLDGDLAAARQAEEAGVDIARRIGNRRILAQALAHVGLVAVAEGELAEAHRVLVEAMEIFGGLESSEGIALTLSYVAVLAAAEDDHTRVATCLAGAATTRERAGLALWPVLRDSEDELAAQARAALGGPSFEAAWQRGRSLTRREAVDLVLAPDEDAGVEVRTSATV